MSQNGITRSSTSQPREITLEMIERWESTSPKLKTLNEATRDKERGFILTKAEAITICGDEESFDEVKQKWKLSLFGRRGVTVTYAHKEKGYLLCKFEHHKASYEKRLRSAERKHREAALALAVIPDADLPTDFDKRQRVYLMQLENDIASKINSQREFARVALTRPETLPRLAVG